MEDKTSTLSFHFILLFLVFLDWLISFFCLTVRELLQICISSVSQAFRACDGSNNLQIIENAGDDDNSEGLARRDVEMVMEKLGFHCDPDEEMWCRQLDALFVEEPSIGEVRDAFQVFDENMDGYIDAGELNKVLRTLGFVEASEVECKKMIQVYDYNGDGRIDFDEFTKLLENSFC